MIVLHKTYLKKVVTNKKNSRKVKKKMNLITMRAWLHSNGVAEEPDDFVRGIPPLHGK